ncbi:MAG: winged helix-turn-helix transcriptional regulator [Microbacteriaceae bacterium]|nr:winged helix-turn-helix transcriptional regulator [Microbacteriaceae bacterium]
MTTAARGPEPAPAVPADAAVESLEVAFRRLTQLMKRSARDFASAVHPELRPAGWVVLGAVLRCGQDHQPVTVGDVIAETGMDKSVVSRQLRSLSDWGLVTLSRSDADARVVVVEVSPLAHERLRVVRARQRERYVQILGDWSPDDVQQLERLLHRVADAFVE